MSVCGPGEQEAHYLTLHGVADIFGGNLVTSESHLREALRLMEQVRARVGEAKRGQS